MKPNDFKLEPSRRLDRGKQTVGVMFSTAVDTRAQQDPA